MNGDNDSRKESGRRREVERVPRGGTPGFSSAALRAALDRHNITAEDLADEVGVSHQAVSSWLSGLTTPAPGSLVRIADALSLSPADLTPGTAGRAYIGDLRARAGLTQGQAAQQVGIAASGLSAIERGRRRVDEDIATRLAVILKVSEQDVLTAWENGLADRDRLRADRFAARRRGK